MAPLKKRIRDLERTLKRKSPEDEGYSVLLENLNKLKTEVDKKNDIEKEKKLAKKYHFVKFVERQKLVRKIHNIEHKLDEPNISKKEKSELKDEKKKLKDDLIYVIYFPHSFKYLGLLYTSSHNIITSIKFFIIHYLSLALFGKNVDNEDDYTINQREKARALAKEAYKADKDVIIIYVYFVIYTYTQLCYLNSVLIII